jgi:hypothetical protein
MGTAAVACSSCGKPISGSDILYSAEGNMVCAGCSDVASLRGHEQSAAGNIQKAAWSCLTCSVLAWFFDPFFSVDVLCLLSGLFAIRSIGRGNERFTRYLGGGAHTQVWVCTILGFVIMGIHLLLVLLVFGAVATSFHQR